jgi:CHAT domain-containing protein
MITNDPSTSLFLNISLKQEKLSLSISEEDAPCYQTEEIPFHDADIKNLCEDVRYLLSQANLHGRLAVGLLAELKKVCQLLHDQLLSARVKKRLKNSKSENLVIQVDEKLVYIPWELLYNGVDFLCLFFNIGRRVITQQPLPEHHARPPHLPLKMLILADPAGDLPEARKEAQIIRDKLDINRDVLAVSLKTSDIPLEYVRRNIRDYDFVHFAGHAVYKDEQPALSGWKLSDQQFSAQEIQTMQGGAPFPALIFLNSCQSAQASASHIDDAYEERCFGLVHAFLTVGIKHYIGTLWKISDPVGLVFAGEFYRQIQCGASIGQAVRQSRWKILKESGPENIHWASYVLYGDPKYTPFPRGLTRSGPSTVRLGFRAPLKLVWAVIGVILCLFFGLSFWYVTRHKQLASDQSPPVSGSKTILSFSKFKLLDRIIAQLDHSRQYDADWAQQLISAKQSDDPAVVAQVCYSLAEQLREKILTGIVFSGVEHDLEVLKNEWTAPYTILLKLYNAADQYAQEAKEHNLQAYARLHRAEINRLYGECDLAGRDYEASLRMLSAKTDISTADRFAILNALIDLAGIYALDHLDFTRAQEKLDDVPVILKGIDGSGGAVTEAEQLVLHRYDHMLLRLATSRYANSHFAHRAKEIRQILQKGFHITEGD